MTRTSVQACVLVLLATLLFASAGHAASYTAAWTGQRNWIGPDYWTIRWQDWRVDADTLLVESRPGRSCILLTHEVKAGDGESNMRVTMSAEGDVTVAGGIWAGVNGPVNDWRSAGAYGEYRVFAGVRPDGTILLRDASFEHNATLATKIDVRKPFDLRLRSSVSGSGLALELQATQTQADGRPPEGGIVKLELEARSIQGLIGLGTAGQPGAAAPAGGASAKWRFHQFSADGERLIAHPDRTYGPIGWTQYTCANGVLKLTALMLPVGDADSKLVRLLIDRNGTFQPVGESPIDPVSRTAHFRVENIKPDQPLAYRISYDWQGKTYTYDGHIRPEPTGPFSVAVMSCDWGYAFPNTPIVEGIKGRGPDLLVYAGDQIYEHFGKFGIERQPLDRAALDYLRKYHLFGIINRDLLRDHPSVIIPDDHDVYQGNIWGAGGIKQKPGGDEMGGYQQSADWLNAMQRTQSWHLPDAVDPTPIAQGITVYYGGFTYGNVAFSVLEDRKWKTGFRSIWRTKDEIPTDLEGLDPPGTSLLGERQEKFLADWGKEHPDMIHVAISQTAFAKAHTHSGPKMQRNTIDFDTNGWPRTPRNRAVRLLGEVGAIHLCGDQHLGALMQMGADTWDDGPLAFMVPGTANGWPRAWWPLQGGDDRLPGAPEITGKFLDAFGNKMNLYALANPQEDSHLLTSPEHSPEDIAQAKGSGFGLMELDPKAKSARFQMFRFRIDSKDPRPEDQFEGFPMSFRLIDGHWKVEKP